MPIHCGKRWVSTILPTHHTPLCQTNHDKSSAAFSLATSGSVGIFWIGGFSVWLCQLMVSGGWFHGFAAAGCVAPCFAMAGLAEAGFEVVNLVVLSLAVVRFKQHQVH